MSAESHLGGLRIITLVYRGNKKSGLNFLNSVLTISANKFKVMLACPSTEPGFSKEKHDLKKPPLDERLPHKSYGISSFPRKNKKKFITHYDRTKTPPRKEERM